MKDLTQQAALRIAQSGDVNSIPLSTDGKANFVIEIFSKVLSELKENGYELLRVSDADEEDITSLVVMKLTNTSFEDTLRKAIALGAAKERERMKGSVEEIYDSYFTRDYDGSVNGDIMEALEDAYASGRAKMGEFAEWTNIESWKYNRARKEWTTLTISGFVEKTTDELINLYQNKEG